MRGEIKKWRILKGIYSIWLKILSFFSFHTPPPFVLFLFTLTLIHFFLRGGVAYLSVVVFDLHFASPFIL